MPIKIDSNIPIPGAGRSVMDEISKMKLKVGQSFFIDTENNRKLDKQLRNKCYSTAREQGISITVAAEGSGFRCWRTAAKAA